MEILLKIAKNTDNFRENTEKLGNFMFAEFTVEMDIPISKFTYASPKNNSANPRFCRHTEHWKDVEKNYFEVKN